MAFARRESTVITAAKKYQAPKDERAQAKGKYLGSKFLGRTFGVKPFDHKLIFFSEMNAKLAKKKGPVSAAPGEEVSPTIYVENLPSEANESMLNLLFQQFPGFKKRNSGQTLFIKYVVTYYALL